MPQPSVAPSIARRRKEAIERYLREGFSPLGQAGGLGSAVARAAKHLRIKSAGQLAKWVRGQEALAKAGKPNCAPDWSLWNQQVTKLPAGVRASRPRRWLLTAAQNDTKVHAGFWRNLQAYAADVGATIVVGPFTYQLGTFTDHTTRNNEFAEAVRPHLRFERMECGDVLFCAEMNTLPTAVRPLSGLHSYTRGQWGVFPHAKIALETVPAMPGRDPAILMTTGCCTIENYVPKKAGLKALFHHVIGATLVEIDDAGRHFCRQINATKDGDFYDLDAKVSRGVVSRGHRVAAIQPGDIHAAVIDPDVERAIWGGEDALIDALRPFDQFHHDLFHGQAINHWQADKPFERYPLHVRGKLDVAAEVSACAAFLRKTQRTFCRTHVVESNHDEWIWRWLQRADIRGDLTNAEAFHRWSLATLEAARAGEKEFSIFRHALAEADAAGLEGINFIPIGSSFEICRDRGGIECGAHGHLGPNGTRGTTASLSRTAVKINKGHDHTATIMDAVYSAGVCGDDPALLKGPSSHTPSLIITYANAKRTIITMQGALWRA